MCRSDWITKQCLPPNMTSGAEEDGIIRRVGVSLKEAEKELIEKTLRLTGGKPDAIRRNPGDYPQDASEQDQGIRHKLVQSASNNPHPYAASLLFPGGTPVTRALKALPALLVWILLCSYVTPAFSNEHGSLIGVTSGVREYATQTVKPALDNGTKKDRLSPTSQSLGGIDPFRNGYPEKCH